MKPVVDHAEFDAIACNRCGACCAAFTLNWNPAEVLERARTDTRVRFTTETTHAQTVSDLETIVDMLLPCDTQVDGTEPTWTCRHFSRDGHGLGVCGIYDRRPGMCSNFPYGRPNRLYAQCSFNVRRVQKHLPVLAS